MDIVEPVEVSLVKALRHEGQIALFERFDRAFGHLVHPDEPLLLDHRLDGRPAAVMGPDGMGVRHYLDEQAELLQILDHGLAGLVAVHAGILAAQVVHGRVVIENIDLLEVVALAHLKVVGVVSRRDLDAAGPEFLIDVRVGDDRDLAVRQRQLQRLADDVGVALVVRIDRHGRIAKQGLWTGRRDLDEAAFLSDHRIIDVPEKAVLVLVLDLGVRDRRLAHRAPVDDL